MKHFRDEIVIKAFGERVRFIRIEKGLTMEKLAAQCDMEYKQLARIEGGQVNTSISRAVSIAVALGVDIRELLSIKN